MQNTIWASISQNASYDQQNNNPNYEIAVSVL